MLYDKISLLQYDLLKLMLDEDPTKRPTTLGIKAKPPLFEEFSIADFQFAEL